MTGFEAVQRFGVETIYKLTRKTSARVRARDLIPPATFHRRDGGFMADLMPNVVLAFRAARWWDDYAGPLMRRLQAAMLVKLQAHVARRQAAMWANHDWTLKVHGERDRDVYTGTVRN